MKKILAALTILMASSIYASSTVCEVNYSELDKKGNITKSKFLQTVEVVDGEINEFISNYNGDETIEYQVYSTGSLGVITVIHQESGNQSLSSTVEEDGVSKASIKLNYGKFLWKVRTQFDFTCK